MSKEQIVDERLDKLEARVAKLEQGKKNNKDRAFKVDIDDPKYGDPKVFMDPSGWMKDHPDQPMKGKPFSQCPPEYLDNLANFLKYLGDKDDAMGRKTSTGKSMGWMKRMDAAKAEAWAARIRGSGPAEGDVGIDDLPF